MKIQSIYSLKERAIKDIKKSPSWGYYFILTIWFVIITMILCASPSKATSEPLQFGEILKDQISSLDTKWQLYDIDRLAHAVAIAETGDCTTGIGPTHNNCFGIRYKGKFARYQTKEAAYKDFKRIWSKYYGGLPDHRMARKWTGGDHAGTWLANVNSNYYE